jgi:hypothetical protein
MNDLDWVLFTGNTVDNWTKSRLHQWSAKNKTWTELDAAQNTLKYMEALQDITEGAPDGIFTDMFCQVLFAQKAAIDTLTARVLKMSGDGEIVSENYDDGSQSGHDRAGFRMKADGGTAVFNKIDTFEMRGYSKLYPSVSGGPNYPNVTGRVYGYIRGHCSGLLNVNGTVSSLRKTENIESVSKQTGSKTTLAIKLQNDGWTDFEIYSKMRIFGYAIGGTSASNGATLYDNYLFIPYFNGYNTSTGEMIIKLVRGNTADSYTVAQSLYFDLTLYC